MKLQQRFPYDATILGLNGTYQTIGKYSFYINSPCVLATDKTITIGKEYVLFSYLKETEIEISDVNLVDAYYFEKVINLIVRDIRSYRVSYIDQCIECSENDCKWVLIDINYFIDRMNTQAIEDYCGCTNNKKQPIGEGKTKFTDDLLEFDF